MELDRPNAPIEAADQAERDNRITVLQELGATVIADSEWIGTAGVDRQKRSLPGTIARLQLPLSAEQWCQLAQREGQAYVGGCCSAMSELQDLINQAFRNSGWIDNHDLLDLGLLARDHDGFEQFALPVADVLAIEINDPWDRLAQVVALAEPMLQPRSLPHKAGDDERDAIMLLRESVNALSWHELFTTPDDPDRHDQWQAQGMLLRAKLVPALTAVYQRLQHCDDHWQGFALIADGQVLTTVGGLCLYSSIGAAEQTLEYWRRAQPEVAALAQLVSAELTIADGLSLGDLVL
jgi:hypothetical protein